METLPDAIEILPGKTSGTIRVPPSKSYTNRALLLAALANGDSTIRDPLRSDDAEAMTEALRALGVPIDDHGDHLIVHGTGRLTAPDAPIDCRDSGTTIRFLTAAAALCDRPVTLTGSTQLQRRPLGPLLDALTELGVEVSTERNDGCPPVTVRGPIRPGRVTVDASKSSQYASAILMALGAIGDERSSLNVHPMVSAPYVGMTLVSMRAFGVDWASVEQMGYTYEPAEGETYLTTDYRVEFDASAAGHIMAVACLSGGEVVIDGVNLDSRQPDIMMAGFLAQSGADVTEMESALRVARVGDSSLSTVYPGVLMQDWPDMLTTVAVVAAFAKGRTAIVKVAHARLHETDRITATATELRKMGVTVEEQPDGLIIEGGQPHGARIDTYGDHRMAMSFAAAGAAVPGVIIENPACVRKTYPGFWDDLRRLGVDWRAA